MGKCYFNPAWLRDERFVEWLGSDVNNTEVFFCRVCRQNYTIGLSGVKALTSHMGTAKHTKNFQASKQSVGIFNFLKTQQSASANDSKSNSKSTTNAPDKSTTQTEPTRFRTLDAHVSDEHVLSAEIRWVLHLVNSHSSARSSDDVASLFRNMFPDSSIAKRFQCARTKAGYMATFGLAPAILKSLLSLLKDANFFVLLFDESFNNELQSKQMDVHVRFLKDGLSHTRYLTSFFMGHAKAVDIEKNLKKVLSMLNNDRLLQISMDGPNVNWKVFKDFSAELDAQHSHQLVNIGSCGLHVIHNAFKDGVRSSDWDLSVLLRSTYFLFQESPARRADFYSVTGSRTLPLQFCGHRWLENLPAAERLISIWPAVKSYFLACKNGKTAEPLCKSYKIVNDFLSDKLIIAKLHCFVYLSNILLPFLQKYQTNEPVVIFLTDDLFTIIKRLYFLILKDDAVQTLSVDDCLHPSKLDKSLFKAHSSISLGNAAELEMKSLKGKVSDLDSMKLKMSFQKFVISIIGKIVDKSPIKYSFARNITCLNPDNFSNDDAPQKFEKVVSYLGTRRWLSDEEVDSSKYEYSVLRKLKRGSEIADGKRIDEFFRSVKELNTMPSLTKVINICLCLSHGNAEVERGFSVNKEVSVENMSEECLIAKRLICQFIKENGEPANISLSKAILTSCSGAYQRYKLACEEKRDALEKEKKQRGVKRQHEEVKELKLKRRKLELDIDMLIKKADDLSEEAEGHASLKKTHELLVQSNAFRKEAKTKKTDLASLIASIQTLEGEQSF